ncbi:MAG: Kdo hydroxylase family protein [Caulobacteraceae bacterium]
MATILELSDIRDGGEALDLLERGGLVTAPRHGFALDEAERRLLDIDVSDGRSKNISLDPATGQLGGTEIESETRAALTQFITRFSDWSEALVRELAPSYGPHLQRKRASFRPAAIDNRALSKRKDDRRLHIDAFPANPVQGRRILRVFANINPAGEARVWNVGDHSFEAFAGQFEGRLKPSSPVNAWALQKLGLTKGRRSAYDAAMLQLHDLAKLDDGYQANAPRTRVEFPAGSAWIVFTDTVLHAALSGSHALEQTFLLPPEAMREQARAPVRVLERRLGRRLV